MRAYLNDITANTLDLIKALKADAVELQRFIWRAAEAACHWQLAQGEQHCVRGDPLQTVKRLCRQLVLQVLGLGFRI